MPTVVVEYARTHPEAGEAAAYTVVIDGRAAARIARVGRRWRLDYAGFTLTLASLGAARALVERYADRIRDGTALDAHQPFEGPPGAKHKAG